MGRMRRKGKDGRKLGCKDEGIRREKDRKKVGWKEGEKDGREVRGGRKEIISLY